MAGRKSKIDEWLTPESLLLIENWAKGGLTEKQIAHNMGISEHTLNEWKKKKPQLIQSLKKGKEIVDYEVINALYQAAIGGNVTAMIFWLKNRRPDKWCDKPQPPPIQDEEEQIDELSAALMQLAEDMENSNSVNYMQ